MSATPTLLRGMTWDHPRGFDPMVATAQRFHELNPGTKIVWEKRPLKAFEDYPVERLTADFDLIVLDHPSISRVAKRGVLVPLDEHLPQVFLADQAANSVGASHESYDYAGHHWALAIDAATPVAFWREDLLARHGLDVPRTWVETLELARRGHVEVPAAPINCLMNFYTMCAAAGETPFTSEERVAPPDVGLVALMRLRELLALAAPGCWARNPIASHDLVSSAANTQLLYCPLAYGYSNYARAGFSPHWLSFGEPPTLGGAALRTTLGGAGLGVSAQRPHVRDALAYAEFVASGEVQRTLYAHSGGQPGHRSAWLDPETNRLTGGYFLDTLPALNRALLRPRYPGYMHFQDSGAPIVHAALRGELADTEALNRLDTLYRETLSRRPSAAA